MDFAVSLLHLLDGVVPLLDDLVAFPMSLLQMLRCLV